MPANAKPWRCWIWNRRTRAYAPIGLGQATLVAAKGMVERPYLSGLAVVLNGATGERWERRGGAWFLIAPGIDRKRRARG